MSVKEKPIADLRERGDRRLPRSRDVLRADDRLDLLAQLGRSSEAIDRQLFELVFVRRWLPGKLIRRRGAKCFDQRNAGLHRTERTPIAHVDLTAGAALAGM